LGHLRTVHVPAYLWVRALRSDFDGDDVDATTAAAAAAPLARAFDSVWRRLPRVRRVLLMSVLRRVRQQVHAEYGVCVWRALTAAFAVAPSPSPAASLMHYSHQCAVHLLHAVIAPLREALTEN
jgi:hypothetical protein